ncbi:MAG TPA: HEAT repeat domain-containing protein [Tepidisphaeraceae bacterium]|nr:HEAT repeat domain-containing protein [Tepidisphaeraceae bacterium]
MPPRTRRLLALLLAITPIPTHAADETDPAPPVKSPAPNKGKLQAAELIPFGAIGSPVGITVDDTGRVYVTETNRRTNGELDIRKLYDFLVPTLSHHTVEDKRAFVRANFNKGAGGDANKDGKTDWHDLTVPTEKIYLLIDADNDGKYESKHVFADNFRDEVTGVAGGVLAFNGHVYTTIQPDVWRLTPSAADPLKADRRLSVSHGHGVHIGYGGHDMHGLTPGPDGRIYWSQGDKGYSLTTKDGKTLARQYEGAVFRVDPDGSNLEVFAYGLRNTQELAFDDFGNLFSVDNDADIGDRERFVYIAENSDTGWRATYQYRSRKIPGVTPGGYNPWLAEELWKPHFNTQAAYLLPPLSNYSDGPCGFKYNPGTALSDEFKGHFFLTQFPKKLLTAFRAEPSGAGFKMVADKVAFSGLMLTGIAFGPDGAIYGADWGDNAWAPHQKGRAVRIDLPGTANGSGPRVETKRLLAEGPAKRPIDELASLLAYPDQRVRLASQFELVKRAQRGATAQSGLVTSGDHENASLATLLSTAKQNDNLLARTHAIWGLGQIARTAPPSPARANTPSPTPTAPPRVGEGGGEGQTQVAEVVKALINLLADKDPEIRSQSAKVLADARHAPAIPAIANLIADENPRVRYFAAHALGQLAPLDPAAKPHLPAILDLLAKNENKDAYLRHAGVTALIGLGSTDPAVVANLSTHADRNVRLAAVVALRRLASPLVARFLADADEWVVTEAARAIHDDTSIPDALPALASALDRAIPGAPTPKPTGLSAGASRTAHLTIEPLVRRAINANLRVGDSASAHRLAKFAASGAAPNLRSAAVDALAWFATTPKLDMVEGRFRDLGQRDEKLPQQALDPVLTKLLNDPAPAVRNSTIAAIQQLNFGEARDRLVALALDDTQPPAVRAPAVEAAYALKSPKAAEAVDKALKSTDPPLRATARTVLAQMKPTDAATLAELKTALAGDSIIEQQGALSALALMKHKDAATLLNDWVDRLAANTVPRPLQLDVIDAATAYAAAAKDKALPAKLKNYQSAKGKDPSAIYAETLEGGDALDGEFLFKSGLCTQCHSLGEPGGAAVGPDLSKIAVRLPRPELLQSIVDPNARIAEGFATVTVTTTDGDSHTGLVLSESPTELVLKDAEGQTQKIKKSDIDFRGKPSSAMPPMHEVMKPREIRNVIEYLSTLK